MNIVQKSAFVRKSLLNIASAFTANEVTEYRREQVKLKMRVGVQELLAGKRKVKNFYLDQSPLDGDIFLKNIAAIIHFLALMPPYTREVFRPPYTPRSIYAFLQPQISVCIPP